MNHPNPNKLFILQIYRRYLLAFKKKNGTARSLVHYKDYVQSYLTAKRQYLTNVNN